MKLSKEKFIDQNLVTTELAKESKPVTPAKMISVKAIDKNNIRIDFENEHYFFREEDVLAHGKVNITNISADNSTVFLKTTDLNFKENYAIEIKGYKKLPVTLDVMLDPLSSDKPLGCILENEKTLFRLFAPRANSVALVLFKKYNSSKGKEYAMSRDEDGVWEIALAGTHWGKYYGYKVDGPQHSTEKFLSQKVLADPYSKAVVRKNSYLHESKSIIIDTKNYNWEGDEPLKIPWEDLIIYEMHIRDLTVHPSSGIKKKGTYHGLIEKGGAGGINHILELGVNAVELLPCHEFGNIEIPYKVKTNGVMNSWNPYARNHWGYMTSYFFAPESYYASKGTMAPGRYNGTAGQQINEFKDMVKAFHKEGIAVIMDVVYNHVSQYDLNPLKYIDKKYYFDLDPMLDFTTISGCGNDFKTERPMARRLIIDSIKYWLQEYHIDGFRFDLATMIDWETVEQITEEAKKINPNVILIAEPWGGGKYDLAGFSERGWGAWNDLFRNGIKGQNPENGLGWIFGNYWADNNLDKIKAYTRGSTKDYDGPFVRKSHSINYLESHDDHTLGDFIRIGSGGVKPHAKIKNLPANAKLSEQQMKLHKLAAAFLLTSQGAVMIGEGQEFARSKVIAKTDVPDKNVGSIDHNSYNKDNETNWLNFNHKELNRDLFDYYRGLVELRKAHRAFRDTPSDQIQFFEGSMDFSLGYLLPKKPSGDVRDFIVLFNANPYKAVDFNLPAGQWRKVVDRKKAGSKAFGTVITNHTKLPPTSVMVLTK